MSLLSKALCWIRKGLEAKIKAESEYEVFRKTQDQTYVSDFDKEIKRLKGE